MTLAWMVAEIDPKQSLAALGRLMQVVMHHFNSGAAGDFSTAEYVSTEAATANPVFNNRDWAE